MLNSEYLDYLMKENGIKNLRVLSRKCNVAYTTLRHAYTGHDMFVGTLIEIAKFFEVPIDNLINKNYGIVSINNKGEERFIKTTNIYEAMNK